MNFKSIAAASVIALLPATGFATINIGIEGNDGVGLDAVSGSGVTSDPLDNLTNVLLIGPEFALDWNMRVINTLPPGAGNTDATVDFDFVVTQDSTLLVTSTQNPFGQLAGLTLDLLINGASVGPVGYTLGAFAALDTGAVKVTSADSITVRADWSSMPGPFSEVDVDFVLSASNFTGTDIPLPASALLLIGALGGLGLVARRRNKAAA